MLKVRMTRAWGGKKPGEVAEFDEARASWLLDEGYAEEPDAKPLKPKRTRDKGTDGD